MCLQYYEVYSGNKTFMYFPLKKSSESKNQVIQKLQDAFSEQWSM